MNINYAAPLNQTGYGVAGYNILKALHSLNHNLTYFPIGTPSVDSFATFPKINVNIIVVKIG
jgi:hypothetical protein